jgi:hypothetical protein
MTTIEAATPSTASTVPASQRMAAGLPGARSLPFRAVVRTSTRRSAERGSAAGQSTSWWDTAATGGRCTSAAAGATSLSGEEAAGGSVFCRGWRRTARATWAATRVGEPAAGVRCVRAGSWRIDTVWRPLAGATARTREARVAWSVRPDGAATAGPACAGWSAGAASASAGAAGASGAGAAAGTGWDGVGSATAAGGGTGAAAVGAGGSGAVVEGAEGAGAVVVRCCGATAGAGGVGEAWAGDSTTRAGKNESGSR